MNVSQVYLVVSKLFLCKENTLLSYLAINYIVKYDDISTGNDSSGITICVSLTQPPNVLCVIMQCRLASWQFQPNLHWYHCLVILQMDLCKMFMKNIIVHI